MALQTVAKIIPNGTDPTIWRLWTVQFNAILVLLYSSAAAGWLALDHGQREALMTWVGLSPENQSVAVSLVMFIGAASSAFTIGLRALKQVKAIGEQPSAEPAP